MLKFSEPDLRQLVFQYGIEDSQILQNSKSSELHFEQFSQSQAAIVTIYDSSDNESFLVDTCRNPTTTSLNPELDNEIKKFRDCDLTEYAIDFQDDGIYGFLVQQIRIIFSLMDPQNGHHTYFSIGNVSVTYHFLSRILQGVHYSKLNSSISASNDLSFSENNTWLEDKHIDCFTYLLELHNYKNDDHQDNLIPVIIEPHFYSSLLFDSKTALHRLKQKLCKFKIISHQGNFTGTLLFPLTINNNHWQNL
jgi:hypothetical protein